MFSDVNSLVFLLIFLGFLIMCLMVYHRVSVPCAADQAGWETVQKLLMCGLTALLLTVAAIYLWYLTVLLLLVAAKFLYDQCISRKAKWLIITGMLAFAVLVAAAGIQMMICQNEEEDDDDAVLEDMTENGAALITEEGLWITVLLAEEGGQGGT